MPGQAPNPAAETLRMLGQGRTLDEIARSRGRQLSTVVSMVATMVERGEAKFEPGWIQGDHQEKIEQACGRLGLERLRALKVALPAEVTYEEIKLVIAQIRRKRSQSQGGER